MVNYPDENQSLKQRKGIETCIVILICNIMCVLVSLRNIHIVLNFIMSLINRSYNYKRITTDKFQLKRIINLSSNLDFLCSF